MKKYYFWVVFFSLFLFCILSNIELTIYYACLGINLWYTKMIPSLLPMMIVSGIIIRMNLHEGIVSIFYPVFRKIFHLSKAACYVFIFGFLCGFPMGAKTIEDLFKRNELSPKEAELLLMFCNNIGPAYFLGFVIPLLHRKLVLPYIFGMYGIPLLYGLFLRYCVYKKMEPKFIICKKTYNKEQLLDAIEDSVYTSVQSILMLGGYMILCNIINVLLIFLPNNKGIYIMPLLEISGGLSVLKYRTPLYSLLLLQFGGLSCFIQTFSCLKSFSITVKRKYILHKCFITIITGLYYLLWYFLFPKSFLQ